MSSLQQNWRRGENRFCLEARGWGLRERVGVGGEKAQTMYAHMNKLLNKQTKKLNEFQENTD
jgi:hypothetical protein